MSKHRVCLVSLTLLFCTLFLSGCSLKLPKSFAKPAPTSNITADALLIDQYAIYNRTISLIQSAQTSIYVEQTVLNDPQIVNLLLAKSKAGVDVRILLDQWQKANWDTMDQLKSQNVSIQYYPAQKGQTDNAKILIVDQNDAILYGPTWTAQDFQAHNAAIELTGKSAWKAAGIFSNDWSFTTTFPLNVPKTTNLPEDNITLATNSNVKEQLSELISSSTSSILIENSEITDPDLDQALIDAAGKGRKVQIIVDSSVAATTPVTLENLKAGGVDIRYYPTPNSQGVRMAIIDNKSVLLSNSDWTKYIFTADHEFSATIPSAAVAQKLTQMFEQDWNKSKA